LKKKMNSTDLAFLVDRALSGLIVDITVEYASSEHLACSYGHRIAIPDRFSHLGVELRQILLANMIRRKIGQVERVIGSTSVEIDRNVTKGEFAHYIFGKLPDLSPLVMNFVPVTQSYVDPALPALWRWQGAIRQAIEFGADISYDCGALQEASRLFHESNDANLTQRGSTVFSDPFSRTEITREEVRRSRFLPSPTEPMVTTTGETKVAERAVMRESGKMGTKTLETGSVASASVVSATAPSTKAPNLSAPTVTAPTVAVPTVSLATATQPSARLKLTEAQVHRLPVSVNPIGTTAGSVKKSPPAFISKKLGASIDPL
jgi:hypothetical protein